MGAVTVFYDFHFAAFDFSALTAFADDFDLFVTFDFIIYTAFKFFTTL